jgi:hypothetical protein
MACIIGKFRKATKKEKKAWEDEKLKFYPLRGFIAYNEIEMAVENTRHGLLEVHAPDGKHFSPDQLHTMLADGIDHLRERLRAYDLEACSEECR